MSRACPADLLIFSPVEMFVQTNHRSEAQRPLLGRAKVHPSHVFCLLFAKIKVATDIPGSGEREPFRAQSGPSLGTKDKVKAKPLYVCQASFWRAQGSSCAQRP